MAVQEGVKGLIYSAQNRSVQDYRCQFSDFSRYFVGMSLQIPKKSAEISKQYTEIRRNTVFAWAFLVSKDPKQINATRLKSFLKFSRFLYGIRFGFKPRRNTPAKTLPAWGSRGLCFLKLTLLVQLQTAPTLLGAERIIFLMLLTTAIHVHFL